MFFCVQQIWEGGSAIQVYVCVHMAHWELHMRALLFTSPTDQRQNMGHMLPELIT